MQYFQPILDLVYHQYALFGVGSDGLGICSKCPLLGTIIPASTSTLKWIIDQGLVYRHWVFVCDFLVCEVNVS